MAGVSWWSHEDFFLGITYHKSHPFKVKNSVVFSIITKLCNCHHYLISKHFHHPQKKPCTISCHSLFLYPSSPWQPLIYFLCVWICLFLTKLQLYNMCPFVTGFLHVVQCFLFLHVEHGLPWWLSGKESTCNAGAAGLIPGLESHEQRSLAGYSP